MIVGKLQEQDKDIGHWILMLASLVLSTNQTHLNPGNSRLQGSSLYILSSKLLDALAICVKLSNLQVHIRLGLRWVWASVCLRAPNALPKFSASLNGHTKD